MTQWLLCGGLAGTARDIPAFENLASVDRVPSTGAFIVALPMKMRGGSGARFARGAVLLASVTK